MASNNEKRASSRIYIEKKVFDFAKNIDPNKLETAYISNENGEYIFKIRGKNKRSGVAETIGLTKSNINDDYILVVLPVAATRYVYFREYKNNNKLNIKINKIDKNDKFNKIKFNDYFETTYV